MRAGTLRVFFDGGCRPNPGTIEIAIMVGGVAHIDRAAAHGDNGDAEWLALIAAARFAVDIGARDVELIGDSASVVAQANGMARCRSERFRAHLATYRAVVAPLASVRVRCVPRSRNLAGIALAAAHPR